MSLENVERTRQMLGAFDRRDRAAWLALRDPDCEVIPSAMWPEAGAVRGREPAWDFYVNTAEAFERLSGADAELMPGPTRSWSTGGMTRAEGQAAQMLRSTTGS
jgi:ketosteroid isomerase-like protein